MIGKATGTVKAETFAHFLDRLEDVPWQEWLKVGIAIAVGLAIHLVVFWILRRFARRTETPVDQSFVRRLSRPSRVLLPLLAVLFVLPGVVVLSESAMLRHIVSLLLILSMAWLVIALVRASADLINSHYDTTVPDNYTARRMHTQINVISRVLVVLIVIIGIGLALMTFPRVRELGTSLLASAGIAGIIVGFAARPVLENIIAGVQLALTQPINIDDVVIVDGEWGRIEEITTTYVVVRIWDDRRLICPFTKFISESFQNWTRRTADILGTVFIYADYSVPFAAVREELQRIVEQHPKWDKRVCLLQVTDATESAVQMRALVSASSASRAWDLRVDVREKLIEYLQREHPQALPQTRVQMTDHHPDHGGSDARSQ